MLKVFRFHEYSSDITFSPYDFYTWFENLIEKRLLNLKLRINFYIFPFKHVIL